MYQPTIAAAKHKLALATPSAILLPSVSGVGLCISCGVCPAAAPMRVKFVCGGLVACACPGVAWTALVSFPKLRFAAAWVARSLRGLRLMWPAVIQSAAHRFSFSQEDLLQITRPECLEGHTQFHVSMPPSGPRLAGRNESAMLLSPRQARVAARPLLPSKTCEQQDKWQH